MASTPLPLPATIKVVKEQRHLARLQVGATDTSGAAHAQARLDQRRLRR
jgi:hypothetical protein